jgi:hypothetical protein
MAGSDPLSNMLLTSGAALFVPAGAAAWLSCSTRNARFLDDGRIEVDKQ